MIDLMEKRNRRANYILRPDVLSVDDATRFAVCPMDSPIDSPEEILALVESGKANVMRFERAGEPLAVVVCSMMSGPRGKELHVEAVAGKSEANSYLPELLENLEAFASQSDCVSIRCNTIRTGLVRRLIGQGWFVSEIIMRKEVNFQRG
jgi:hypothetical protein